VGRRKKDVREVGPLLNWSKSSGGGGVVFYLSIERKTEPTKREKKGGRMRRKDAPASINKKRRHEKEIGGPSFRQVHEERRDCLLRNGLTGKLRRTERLIKKRGLKAAPY